MTTPVTDIYAIRSKAFNKSIKIIWKDNEIVTFIKSYKQVIGRTPRAVLVNLLDCDIVVVIY